MKSELVVDPTFVVASVPPHSRAMAQSVDE